MTEEIKEIKQERTWLINELESLSFIQKIYPSDANFVLVKVDDATKRYDELISKGIVVRNRSNQPLCENCLRLTVGTETENIKLITTLKELS